MKYTFSNPNPDDPNNYNQVLVLPGFNKNLPGEDLRRDGQDSLYLLRYPDDHYEYLLPIASSETPPATDRPSPAGASESLSGVSSAMLGAAALDSGTASGGKTKEKVAAKKPL